MTLFQNGDILRYIMFAILNTTTVVYTDDTHHFAIGNLSAF